MSSDKKSIPIKPVPADNKADNKAEVVSLYAEHKKIHPRHVTGLFANMRVAMVWLTQLVYFGFPWLTWNGRQAVLFDLVNRKFYFFGITFFPQDFIYVAALLMMCALGLFLWTTIAGRLWCGYACPQTVYTEVFLWFEHLIEGDRSKRIKLDAAPMSARKLGLKTAKHTLWIVFSLITGFTLVAYFTPRTMLIDELLVWDLGPWETFWIFFYAFATYGMAGFMREQVCKYMCPYARFQSVMFDADTLIISYDTERGEPRGTRKKGVDPASVGKGSCVDCGICVQVCPTGIDIRNGLQYECIGCAACIDACDEVMDKMNYPRGLIRYTTENALEKHYPESQIWTRIKRPRVIMYSLVLFTVAGIAITGLMMRQPLKVDILRDRASLVRETQDGLLENTYNIRFINISENPQKLKLSVQGLPGIKLVAERDVFDVPPTGNVLVTLNVQAPPESAPKGSHKIQFLIKSVGDDAVSLEEPSSFIGE